MSLTPKLASTGTYITGHLLLLSHDTDFIEYVILWVNNFKLGIS